jgi:hypothetical protein
MKYLVLFIFLLSSATIFSQNPSVITGKIIDLENDNEPLAFGDITIKGSDKATYSNIDGIYFFEDLTPGDYVLEYSFVGYETEEINVTVSDEKSTEVNVTLRAKTPPQTGVVSTSTSNQDNKTNPSLL